MSWFLWFKHKKPKIGWTISFQDRKFRNIFFFVFFIQKKINKKEIKVNCKRNFPYYIYKTAICFCLNIINTVPQILEALLII